MHTSPFESFCTYSCEEVEKEPVAVQELDVGKMIFVYVYMFGKPHAQTVVVKIQ